MPTLSMCLDHLKEKFLSLNYCRILHTSDIHLDDYLGGKGDESCAQRGLIDAVDKSIELNVDLFLLAGDLFDHNRVKDRCLEFATEQLARVRCPIVMITGNHDCLAEYSIYHRYEPETAGDHIHFIRDPAGAVIDFPELGIKVWGKGIVNHHPDNRPLERVPKKESGAWFIGLAHGYYINRGADIYSSLITAEQIEASGLDYLALGHVHVFSEMKHGNTLAVYPGSPNINQGTPEMTAAFVELLPREGVKVTRIELASQDQLASRKLKEPAMPSFLG